MDIEEILQKNGIDNPIKMLYLSRDLGTVLRCNALPGEKYSVANHVSNCLFLLHYLNHQDYISPPLGIHALYQASTFLTVHDLEEALSGDIPRPFISPEVAKSSEDLRHKMAMSFGIDVEHIGQEIEDLCSIVDTLEFLIHMKDQYVCPHHRSYRSARQLKAIELGTKGLAKANKVSYHKVNYQKFLEDLDGAASVLC